ncbi:MAG: hypothetical protein HYW62_00565 [Candidatus Levybacteria bacterium]|nr:hypothetical protein [Candidatus Levybacteria bacterium]
MANDAGGQIGSAKHQWQSDEERIKFLRYLYGSDKDANPSDGKPTEFEEKLKEKDLAIPKSEQELDEFLAKPLPRKTAG